MRRFCRLFVCVALAAILMPSSMTTLAQTAYPSKPIRLLVGFPPGGFTDLAGRMVAQAMGESLGVQIIVDNRPGSNGSIAAMLTMRAAPDGYTFYMASPGHVTNPILQSQTRYDPLKDFTPLSGFADIPNILVVSPDLPARSIKEFLDLARSRSVPLTQATTGVGAPGHLIGELLQIATKVKFTHVPYKGSGLIMPDLATGRVDFTFSSAASALSHVKAGRIRALGVSGKKRTAAYPDVPTIAEGGVPGFEAVGRYALYGPANMPKPVVDKLAAEVDKLVQRPDIQAQLSKVGADPVQGGAEELATFAAADFEKWQRVIKTARIAGN